MMKSWEIKALELRPHSPQILSSTADARAVVVEIPAGESLTDHQVHERAWVTVIEGEVEVSTVEGERIEGGPGLLVEFDPRERHAVQAHTKARILLLLTPWPGVGHPGAMTVEEKSHARENAALGDPSHALNVDPGAGSPKRQT